MKEKHPDHEQAVLESCLKLRQLYGPDPKVMWEAIQKEQELAKAVRSAAEYQDFEPLALLVEQGNELLFNSAGARSVVAQILRGEIKGKRGHSGRDNKRQDERASFILYRVNYWKGYGIRPVWSADDSGICGIVSKELLAEGFKPMEPQSIYRHVWRVRKEEKRLFETLPTIYELVQKAGAIRAMIDSRGAVDE